MPSLDLPETRIWFAHCPKAGGTSVEQWMVAEWGDAVGHLHWGWDLWWRRGGWRVADPPNSPQHLTWADALSKLDRPPDLVFALVRDPVERIASEYRWQRHGRRGTRMGKMLAYLPFSIWLRVMLRIARLHPHAFDNHLRPQSDFVPETARVFHLEDGLDPVASWLSACTGQPVTAEFPHAIATGTRTAVSPRDRSRIARAYAVDYARFGYRRPDARPGRAPVASGLAFAIAPLVIGLDRRGLM